jgi:hypothetical protein
MINIATSARRRPAGGSDDISVPADSGRLAKDANEQEDQEDDEDGTNTDVHVIPFFGQYGRSTLPRQSLGETRDWRTVHAGNTHYTLTRTVM